MGETHLGFLRSLGCLTSPLQFRSTSVVFDRHGVLLEADPDFLDLSETSQRVADGLYVLLFIRSLVLESKSLEFDMETRVQCVYLVNKGDNLEMRPEGDLERESGGNSG